MPKPTCTLYGINDASYFIVYSILGRPRALWGGDYQVPILDKVPMKKNTRNKRKPAKGKGQAQVPKDPSKGTWKQNKKSQGKREVTSPVCDLVKIDRDHKGRISDILEKEGWAQAFDEEEIYFEAVNRWDQIEESVEYVADYEWPEYAPVSSFESTAPELPEGCYSVLYANKAPAMKLTDSWLGSVVASACAFLLDPVSWFWNPTHKKVEVEILEINDAGPIITPVCIEVLKPQSDSDPILPLVIREKERSLLSLSIPDILVAAVAGVNCLSYRFFGCVNWKSIYMAIVLAFARSFFRRHIALSSIKRWDKTVMLPDEERHRKYDVETVDPSRSAVYGLGIEFKLRVCNREVYTHVVGSNFQDYICDYDEKVVHNDVLKLLMNPRVTNVHQTPEVISRRITELVNTNTDVMTNCTSIVSSNRNQIADTVYVAHAILGVPLKTSQGADTISMDTESMKYLSPRLSPLNQGLLLLIFIGFLSKLSFAGLFELVSDRMWSVLFALFRILHMGLRPCLERLHGQVLSHR